MRGREDPTPGHSLGARRLADSVPQPLLAAGPGTWRTQSHASNRELARLRRDPLHHQGRKFCSSCKQSKVTRLLAKEA